MLPSPWSLAHLLGVELICLSVGGRYRHAGCPLPNTAPCPPGSLAAGTQWMSLHSMVDTSNSRVETRDTTRDTTRDPRVDRPCLRCKPSQLVWSPAPSSLRVSSLSGATVTLRLTARRPRHEAEEKKTTGKAVRPVEVCVGVQAETESLEKEACPDTRRVHRPESRPRCRLCFPPSLPARLFVFLSLSGLSAFPTCVPVCVFGWRLHALDGMWMEWRY